MSTLELYSFAVNRSHAQSGNPAENLADRWLLISEWMAETPTVVDRPMTMAELVFGQAVSQ